MSIDETIVKLLNYVRHSPGCDKGWHGPSAICNCRLDDILKELGINPDNIPEFID